MRRWTSRRWTERRRWRNDDFTAIPATLTFGPTIPTKQVTVLVNGDTTVEPNEAFTVHLSNASGATISDADGTGTITNDDAAPSFSIDDVTHDEGNAGTTSYTFTVTKTGSTALSSSVDYETVNGTAVAPGDFTAIPGEQRTLTFAANRYDQAGNSPGQRRHDLRVD